MDHAENDLFGKIAIAQGFCTAGEIIRCIRIQVDTTENLSLGQSLVREGFISGEQYSEVLKLMRNVVKGGGTPPARKIPENPPPSPTGETLRPEDREDDLLAKLAVREGWLTVTDLRTCLQGVKQGSPRRSLAEMLVAGGYLTPSRAKELLERISPRMMCCRTCKKSFSVLSIAQSKEMLCPKCQSRLEEGRLPESRPSKDPLATQTFKLVSRLLKPPRRPRLR